MKEMPYHNSDPGIQTTFVHLLVEGALLITLNHVFWPGHCVTGFLLPSTGAGTNAIHVSTTRVLLLCRWKERAHLRVNMEKTCTQYSSFALVCGLAYTCNVYFLQTMPVSSF